jgi:type I restriction enzyme S subunit
MVDLMVSEQQSGAAEKGVPAGFKLTEVGIIPEDWECKYLGELGDIVRGGSPRPAGDPKYFEGDFIPWLTVASLTTIPDAQQIVMATSSMLTELGSKHSRTLEKGTLIISNSGATLGVAKLLGIKCCANDGVAAIINQRIGNKSFLIHYINTITKNLHDKIATGNGQPNLNTDLIRLISVPFPNEQEQQKIADTLSDCDNFILKLEQLIAKKQAIKTATMQQLLTGKTRLPQFALWDDGAVKGYKKSELGEIPEDWIVSNFGSVMKIRHGKNQKHVDCFDGEYPIYATGGQIGKANAFLYDKPSVLIGRKGTIDKPRYTDQPFWTVDTLFYSEISESADAQFIYYRFCMIDWMQYNEASGVPSLNAGTIESIQTVLPSIEEQTAIAAILSDMDKEIQTLQQRLDKTRQLKQGMMQELLTGKTRLI